jgi:hypothetical protein
MSASGGFRKGGKVDREEEREEKKPMKFAKGGVVGGGDTKSRHKPMGPHK